MDSRAVLLADPAPAALSVGSARRSIGAPGHNDDRSRTPRHSRPPGRTAAAEALRWSPSPPFWRDSTAATPHGDLDPICRCPLFTLRGAERVPLLSREHGRINGMKRRKRNGLVPIGEVCSGLGGPVKEIREASPQALHHFTQADQVNQLVSASEADPDLGFMARMQWCCARCPAPTPATEMRPVQGLRGRVNGPCTRSTWSPVAATNSPTVNFPRLIWSRPAGLGLAPKRRADIQSRVLIFVLRAIRFQSSCGNGLGVYSSGGGLAPGGHQAPATR